MENDSFVLRFKICPRGVTFKLRVPFFCFLIFKVSSVGWLSIVLLIYREFEVGNKTRQNLKHLVNAWRLF